MPTAVINGVPMTHSLSSSQRKKASAWIDAAHKETRARFRSLETAIKLNHLEQQRDDIDWLTTNPIGLLSHAVKANARMHPTKRVSLDTCLDVPKNIGVCKPIHEPVEMYAKPKTGGFRVIHEFGIVHRTIQLGIRQVGSRYYVPRPFQYTQTGVAEAISAARKALLDGHVHVAEIDIKRFYSSFQEDKLLDEFTLPKAVELPEGLVKNVVFSRRYKAGWKKGGHNRVPPSTLGFRLNHSQNARAVARATPDRKFAASLS